MRVNAYFNIDNSYSDYVSTFRSLINEKSPDGVLAQIKGVFWEDRKPSSSLAYKSAFVLNALEIVKASNKSEIETRLTLALFFKFPRIPDSNIDISSFVEPLFSSNKTSLIEVLSPDELNAFALGYLAIRKNIFSKSLRDKISHLTKKKSKEFDLPQITGLFLAYEIQDLVSDSKVQEAKAIFDNWPLKDDEIWRFAFSNILESIYYQEYIDQALQLLYQIADNYNTHPPQSNSHLQIIHTVFTRGGGEITMSRLRQILMIVKEDIERLKAP